MLENYCFNVFFAALDRDFFCFLLHIDFRSTLLPLQNFVGVGGGIIILYLFRSYRYLQVSSHEVVAVSNLNLS